SNLYFGEGLAGAGGFAFPETAPNHPLSGIQSTSGEEEEEYDGYEDISSSLSSRPAPPTIDEDVSPPDVSVADADPPPGVDDVGFTSSAPGTSPPSPVMGTSLVGAGGGGLRRGNDEEDPDPPPSFEPPPPGSSVHHQAGTTIAGGLIGTLGLSNLTTLFTSSTSPLDSSSSLIPASTLSTSQHSSTSPPSQHQPSSPTEALPPPYAGGTILAEQEAALPSSIEQEVIGEGGEGEEGGAERRGNGNEPPPYTTHLVGGEGEREVVVGLMRSGRVLEIL
ncbi:hypothetical protein P7C70_g3365, partial [Phenoliferia sp. Uapishka_3]